MTSKFENFEHNRSIDRSNEEMELPADNFELLSAYLDGELSSTERKQVQTRLDQDPQLKKLYTRLLALQSQIQSLPVPPRSESAAEIAEKVFQSLSRRRRQRRLLLGGSAIAATFLATITGLIPGISSPSWRLAQFSAPNKIDSEAVMLAVALNKPTIDIPKSINGYNFEQFDTP